MNASSHGDMAAFSPSQSTLLSSRRHPMRRSIFGLFFLLFITIGIEIYIYTFRTSTLLANNLLVFVMINLNIILLLALISLVVRNLLRVYFDQKSKVLGVKFRTKLITAFVGLVLCPSVLLFLFASGLITTSIENWFNMRIEQSLQDALEVAQSSARASETNALRFGVELSQLITDQRLLLPVNAERLRHVIQKKRQELYLDGVQIFSLHRQDIASVFDQSVPTAVLQELALLPLPAGFEGHTESHIVSLGLGDIIRSIVPIWSLARDKVEGAVVVIYYRPRSLVIRLQSIVQTFEDYQQLKTLKGPVKTSYITTFLIITLLIIFSAIWVGLQLAKSITIPIQRLAEGTRLVANGNLDFTVDVTSDDEIGLLVASFNQMTRDLKQSSLALEQANVGLRATNIELERRRSYMETVLENVAAGVISLDNNGRVTTMNKAAAKILELSVADCCGRPYRQVFDTSYLKPFLEFIRTMHIDNADSRQAQMQVVVKGQVLTLLVSLTFLRDSQNNALGTVVVFDDLTALMKAQQVAAWREVARSLAHEIKNPLTPIQLSAQRLQKKFRDGAADQTLVEECTTTIVQQVTGLKKLVGEFSRFARMPEPHLALHDLHKILDEVITLYSGIYNGLRFLLAYDPLVTFVELDREQIKRVFINLIENSIDAMQGEGDIRITTRLCLSRHIVQIELHDTGPGIPDSYRETIFAPYFSTKKQGTGLGLSLAHRVIADHNGALVLAETRSGSGTTFLIELPIV
jgi:two-component system nitrogen regulation sensor histidine kinase NtrY